ncbi:MAG: hypothetical protein V3V00_03115 [Saprospiraceae bacterium]
MALSPGDIAFVGYNGDGMDDFAIVVLTEIDGSSSSETIIFTDDEWNGTMFVGSETSMIWTISSKIIAGTIITFSNTSSGSSTVSVGSIAGTINLNVSNEALFALTGSLVMPSAFLAAIANDDFAAAGASLSGTGLTAGVNALELNATGDADIAIYTGNRSSTVGLDNYLSDINNSANWATESGSGDQSNNGIAPDLPFVTTSFNGCPTFVAGIPSAAVVMNSTCIIFGSTPAGGSISAPLTTCPIGSTLNYSVDDGVTFADTIPDYNQTVALIVKTTCFCDDNNAITSETASVTTIPGTCPNCPTNLSDTIPKAVIIVNSTCTVFGSTPAEGSTAAPADDNCPVGSTIHYSVDGSTTFTDTLPAYGQTVAITLSTTCICDLDNTMTSDTTEVTTIPGTCPLCPSFTGIVPVVFTITESICNMVMGLPMNGKIDTSLNNCSIGSVLMFSVDDAAFSTSLPVYNQMTSQKIEATCFCLATNSVTSDTISTTTTPGSCPALLLPKSQNKLDFGDPCTCSDPLNCEQGGFFYFHDTISISTLPVSSGLVIKISGTPLDFYIGNCGILVTANATTVIPESPVGSGQYQLEYWRPSGSTPVVSIVEGGVIVAIPSSEFLPVCSLSDCQQENIPTVGGWGLIILSQLLLILSIVGIKCKPQYY